MNMHYAFGPTFFQLCDCDNCRKGGDKKEEKTKNINGELASPPPKWEDVTDRVNGAVVYDKANARPIVAAPDLLEACEEVLKLVESGKIRAYPRSASHILRAAIAKAKGE